MRDLVRVAAGIVVVGGALGSVGCGASHAKPTGPAPEYEEPELKMAVPSSVPGASRISGAAAGPIGDAGRD